MNEFRLIQKSDGQWITPGISHGYGVGLNVEMIYRDDNKAILKFKGARDFAGRGYSEYFPTSYLLVEFVSDDRVQTIKEIEPGRKWKKAIEELKEMM